VGIFAIIACSPAPQPDPNRPKVTPRPSYGNDAQCGTDDFLKPDLDELTPCGDGRGHCYDRTHTQLADLLVACPDSQTTVCVPDEVLIAAGTKLRACSATIGEGPKVPGACLTATLVPEISRQGGDEALRRDKCAQDQACVPCTDPTNEDIPTPFCQPMGVHEKACKSSIPPPQPEAGPPEEDAGTDAEPVEDASGE
jgi:hypothetical protein